MNLVQRTLFRSFVFSIRVYQRLFLDLCVWGREHIPKGPKIYVTNHITCTDPFWILPVFTEPVHVVIGPAYQYRVFVRLLDVFEQINALPAHRKSVVDDAVRYLEKGEAVYIAPEGDMQELFQVGRFYPGVGKIYRKARVPIVPIALVAPKRCMHESPQINTVIDGRVYRMINVLRGTYCINVGEPIIPDCSDGTESEQNERIADLVRQHVQRLVEEVRQNKFWL